MIKAIKTEKDYEMTIAEIEKLMDRNPKPNSIAAKKLQFLISLVKEYESEYYTTETPGPIDAIRFRMEQENLRPKDLTKYIGDRENVSEVLSGTKSLTLSMIRALHTGLGIPLKALIRGQECFDLTLGRIDWKKFPISAMVQRGWISKQTVASQHHDAEAIIRQFLQPLGTPGTILALYRKTSTIRSAKIINEYALFVWNACIMIKALSSKIHKRYRPNTVDQAFIKEIVHLSRLQNGPNLAIEYANKRGIPIIIEPHLPQTYLDGASISTHDGPIIGLTIRHDRLDNFWFCLAHELAHIYLHSRLKKMSFYDDLDESSAIDSYEKEADNLAGEMLIPKHEWSKSIARHLRTPEAAKHLADHLRIHPAIVVGKMRHHFASYNILSSLVGNKQVRKCFPDIKWRQ